MFWRLISASILRVDIRKNCKSVIYISVRCLVLLMIRVRFPAGIGTFLFTIFRSSSGTYPVSYMTTMEDSFLGKNQLELESGPIPLSSTDVNNVWSCTLIFPSSACVMISYSQGQLYITLTPDNRSKTSVNLKLR
jgi:hypothetical protein